MLTEQDIAVLLEAMTVWETHNARNGMSEAMLSGLLGRMAPSGVSEEDSAKAIMEKARQKDIDNAEVAILIKAKLVQMKRDAQSRYDRALREGLVPDR
jgi:hypothetical protein